MNFENKVILITGAASGIGADTARRLAKLGGQIALIDCNENGINDVIEQIKKAGSLTPFGIVADITKDAERIIDETIKHFGKLDVLINCAGIGERSSILEAKIDSFDKIMKINVRSVILLTQLAVPHLEATRGNIVNVSSITSMIAAKDLTFYNMSKAALDHFTNCAAVELGPKGIRVNSINPGIVNTPFFQASGIGDVQKKEILDEIALRYPIGRYGEASDMSAAIAYLASDVASFVTGVQLRVDGGAVVAGAF